METQRERRIEIRISDAEKEEWEAAAQAADRSLSSWIRYQINRARVNGRFVDVIVRNSKRPR